MRKQISDQAGLIVEIQEQLKATRINVINVINLKRKRVE